MGKELYEGLNHMPPAERFALSRHKNAEQMTTQGWSGLYWARMNERSSRKFHRVRPRQCQNLYTNPTPTRPNFRVRREGLGGRGVESGLLWRALRERSLDRLRRGALGACVNDNLGHVPRGHFRSDHPTKWKGNSANFALLDFSDVQSRNTAYADSTLADRCERFVFFAQMKALREPFR